MKTLLLICAGLMLALPAQVPAQDYPTKPVRFIVPLAAGGGMDTVARGLAQKLGESLGQAIVVDNRGGGGGSIGAEMAAAAAPDGYTWIMMSATAVIRPLMYQKTGYDLARDFVPVSQVTAQPYVLTVHPSLPIKSVRELVAYAKANPAKLNYASAGQGSLIHLASELFNSTAGIRTVHVPYKGIGAAYPDLITGHVQMVFASIVSVQPHVRAQRLRALAVSSAQRAKAQPDWPTVAEAGIPGFAVTQWYGVFVPARAPRAVVERLNREIIKAVHEPGLTGRFAADGAEAVGSSRQEFAAHIKAEHVKWSKVIHDTGIKGD